jgi:hypothetical protein
MKLEQNVFASAEFRGSRKTRTMTALRKQANRPGSLCAKAVAEADSRVKAKKMTVHKNSMIEVDTEMEKLFSWQCNMLLGLCSGYSLREL